MVAENAQPGKPDINKAFRVMSVESDDLLIEAMVPEKRQGLYKYISFRASAVEHIAALEIQNAEIVLHSGVSIPVGMDARELTKMIFEPDFKTGRKLDLTSVSGVNVKTVWPENMNLKPGMRALDGSVYLGFDGESDWYMAAKDLPLTVSFNKAVGEAQISEAHGRNDWKVPSLDTFITARDLMREKTEFIKAELNLRPSFYVTSTPGSGENSIKVYNPVENKQDWWGTDYEKDIYARLVRSVSRGAP